jgi:hypothetical protein
VLTVSETHPSWGLPRRDGDESARRLASHAGVIPLSTNVAGHKPEGE